MRYKSISAWLCGLILATASSPVVTAADTAYVIDKLLVGVHEDKALDSPVVKVLATGTRVEVIKREGEVAYIRDAEGQQGWVDAGYLMNEQPAALLLESMDKQNRSLSEALREAQARIELLSKNNAPGGKRAGDDRLRAQLEDLQKANDELSQRLASERLKVGELQAKVSELSGSTLLSDSDRTLPAGGPADAAAIARGGASTTARTPAEARPGELAQVGRVLLDSKAVAFTLLVILLAAFGGGVYFMDYINRRRHGGFRV
jgi:SH3 domain protein